MINKLGTWGILIGGLALVLAVVHFWAGPFSSQPTLESVVAEKAASMRKTTIDALKGNSVQVKSTSPTFNADKITQILTTALGCLALIFAALSFSSREPIRVVGSAAVLGVSAISFQFLALYAIAFLVIILISAILVSSSRNV